MFVSLGDGAGFNVVEQDALRAQNLDSLAGKLLHIDSNGLGVASNPFWNGDPGANRSKVWARGVRNAFRLTVNEENGTPFIGDVGWNTWEEISVAPAGANLGWPCYEGPARQGGYEPLAVCQDLYAQGPDAVQPPLVAWDRVGRGSAVAGGVFLQGDKYPAAYQGAYVYADYVSGEILYIHVDAANNLVSGPNTLADNAAGPVDFGMSPDGYLHYLAINSGEIRRIRSIISDPEPGEDVYLSDLPWISMTNGWGPAERNRSNGEDGSADGNTLSLNGTTYAKGLGVHARSEILYALDGLCTTFTAVIGVDDEVGPNGSVTFEVWGDTERLYQSAVHTGSSVPEPVTVNLAGQSQLRLVVDGGADISYDHANWADAKLSCSDGDEPPPPDPGSVFLSDLVWVSMTNDWGPAERDRSNGEDGPADGNPITLNGTTYAKGLGVHARSEIVYSLNGLCTDFLAVIGIDDEVGPNGSVTFEVWGDTVRLYQSGIHTGTSVPEPVSVDLAG